MSVLEKISSAISWRAAIVALLVASLLVPIIVVSDFFFPYVVPRNIFFRIVVEIGAAALVPYFLLALTAIYLLVEH